MTSRPQPSLLCIMMGLFVATTVACGLGGSSDDIVMVNRLPTFTRTPLPPLVQVGDSTPTAVFQLEQPQPASLENEVVEAPQVLEPDPQIPDDSANNNPVSTAPSSDTGSSTGGATNPPPNPQPAVPVVENPTAPPAPAAPLPVVENTPTPVVPEVPTPAVDSPAALPTATPLPTNTPPATATPQTSTGGWSFSATRAGADPYGDGMLLFGEAINNTGASQELSFISGTFYDNLGQVIAGEDDTDDYAPLEVVPPGGRVPFELTVYGLQNAENYELWVSSEVSSQTPRQDLVVSDVEQLEDEGDYCVAGVVRNQGGQLGDYLVVVATLYDAQDNVINFGDDYYSDVEEIVGDDALDFEICIESLEQNVARYEVLAWGQ